MTAREAPLLTAHDLTVRFGTLSALSQVSLEIFPGEVLGIVGESGAGKSTLLRCLSGHCPPTEGRVWFEQRDLYALSEAERRRLAREDWGFVHQTPRDGLRLSVSAGGNVAERLMALGERNYGKLRRTALEWLARVDLEEGRIDDPPATFSGGMQQRVQIARALAVEPKLVFLDEPTGGLDVSVQARLLDLLRSLVHSTGVACLLVTHDLGVVRLLADRLAVMKGGRIVETGLTDQVLDDPQAEYTQLLVSSILAA